MLLCASGLALLIVLALSLRAFIVLIAFFPRRLFVITVGLGGGLYVTVRGCSCYALRLGVRLSVSHVAYLHIYIHKCTKGGGEYLHSRLSEPLQWIKKAGGELLGFL